MKEMKEEARRTNSAHSKGAKRTERRLNAIVVWFSVGEVDAVSMGMALGQRTTETATTTKQRDKQPLTGAGSEEGE
ncbi:predicted protein [Histoplasma mississippiense (nom. inval.)]|uniref:predicted protein n=1 Tax=Ajellomyces capsulatus (strain NAm1 / WU24) TaxID=2059318 RepID=UPI000157B849|nr:predicted protein [Histoplasma mississippiense (nom. inval.)]EDN03510.1 predicted protein [Histoplasma mississippiense (nom. inval.)]